MTDNLSFKKYDTQKASLEALGPGTIRYDKAIVQQVLSLPKPDTDINKQLWLPSYELIDYTIPSVVDYPSINKTFKTQVTFKDKKTGRTASKTIFFGDKKDYVFTRNGNEKLRKLAYMKDLDNPLSADYWRAHICFASSDWVENAIDLIRHTLQENNKKFGNLRPKKDFSHLQKKKNV